MKTILLLILSAFTASAATTYPVMTDNANRTFSGGTTNLAILNGTNTFSGVNTLTNTTLAGKLAVNSPNHRAGVSFTVDDIFEFAAYSGYALFQAYTLGVGSRPAWYEASTHYFTGGSVGVGTASPSTALHVVGTGLTVGTSGAAITKVLSATATLNYDLTALVVEDKTITVTGAGDGDVVTVGVPNGSITATIQFTGWVSATNTVTIRARTSVVGEDPASGTFRATVIRH